MSLTGITDKSEQYFNFQTDAQTFRPYNYNTRLSFELFIDLDLRTIDRQVYNTFVLLGDIGGFSGLLFTIGAIIQGITTY